MIIVHAKVVSYCDQLLEDDFISRTIEIIGCLHQHVNDFFHCCANMAWLAKGLGGPLFSIICSFYR
jgi:hypothetical protein